MSENKIVKGKLKLICGLKSFLRQNHFNKLEEDEYEEIFYDYFYPEWVLVDGDVFKVENRQDLEYQSFYELHPVEQGSYEFIVSYHNGCEGFDEAINQAFKNWEMKG